MSRRGQIEMTDDEIRDFLAHQKTLILCSHGAGGYPHPMPMWFRRDDDGVVYMTTFGKSQKIMNLQRDPRCSLLAESGLEYSELKGVVMYGSAQLVDDTDQVIDTMLALAGGGPAAGGDASAAQAVRDGMRKSASKRILIRVAPERIVSWDHAKLGGVY